MNKTYSFIKHNISLYMDFHSTSNISMAAQGPDPQINN